MTDTLAKGSEESCQQKGDAAFRKGDLEAAFKFYSQTLQLNPDDAWAEYSIAEVFKHQGKLEQAVIHYSNSLKLDPFGSAPLIQLLFTKLKPEQLAPIVSFYQQLSASRPNNPWLSVRLGDLLTKQKEVDSAIVSYRSACYKLLKNNYPEYVNRHWDSNGSSEPSYIIIGPMKTATSALYEYINQHPKVLPSIKKEIHFFNDPAKLSYGKDWYLSHFPPIPQGSGYITGEASPGYIVNHVHHKVFSLFPKVKIIALVRDPVARAFSHYQHNCKHGFEHRSFAESVTAELQVLELVEKDIPLEHIAKKWNWNLYPGYVLLGLYSHFLQQWYAAFPHEQILVIDNQALSNRPEATMQQLFSFLQLDPYNSTNYPRHNAGSYTAEKEIDCDIKSRLQEFFHPYEESLQVFLTDKKWLSSS